MNVRVLFYMPETLPTAQIDRASTRPTHRIGSVSFLNAKPLIYGLGNEDDRIKLTLDVPSALLSGFEEDRFDVALLPVIDYQRLEGLVVLTSGGIGCYGPTLTVRIFSSTPVREIRTLVCDTDSHTSVALARIVLAERYGIQPKFVSMDDPAQPSDAARLLIGDKVICDAPSGFDHQIDLGEEWKLLTGLPFVFAAWMARREVAGLKELAARLDRAKREGLAHVVEIIEHHAIPRGWPPDIARQYLTEYLKFDIGEKQLEGIRRFHALAVKHGVIAEARTLIVAD